MLFRWYREIGSAQRKTINCSHISHYDDWQLTKLCIYIDLYALFRDHERCNSFAKEQNHSIFWIVSTERLVLLNVATIRALRHLILRSLKSSTGFNCHVKPTFRFLVHCVWFYVCARVIYATRKNARRRLWPFRFYSRLTYRSSFFLEPSVFETRPRVCVALLTPHCLGDQNKFDRQ